MGGQGSHGALHLHSIPGAWCKDTLGGCPTGTEPFPGCWGQGRWLCCASISRCCPDRGAAGEGSHCWESPARGVRAGGQRDPLRVTPPELSPCHQPVGHRGLGFSGQTHPAESKPGVLPQPSPCCACCAGPTAPSSLHSAPIAQHDPTKCILLTLGNMEPFFPQCADKVSCPKPPFFHPKPEGS